MSDRVTLWHFLLARIAEDEREAQQAEDARALRECSAKRRMIRNARAAIRTSDATPSDPDLSRDHKGRIHGVALAYEEVIAAMVTVYADHPDYNPEWAE